MHVTFYGAVREVTGSMHLISSETDRVLLDCGLFQGRRRESDRKNRTLPFDPRILTNVGALPRPHRPLWAPAAADPKGFYRPHHLHPCHRRRLQLPAARQRPHSGIRRRIPQLQDRAVAPLRTEDIAPHKEGQQTRGAQNQGTAQVQPQPPQHRGHRRIDRQGIIWRRCGRSTPWRTPSPPWAYFDGYPYREPVAVGRGMHCTFYDAGHILGSAVSIIRLRENGR